MPRKESFCGRIAFSGPGTQLFQYGITCRTSSWRRILFYRIEAILRWGNSCGTNQDSDRSSVSHTRERKWQSIRTYPSFRGRTLAAAISKFVMILVLHYDQDQQDTDGAVDWDTINLQLMRDFGSRGARGFSEQDWFQHISEGSKKTRGVRVLRGFEKFLDVHPCNSRTHWWKCDCTGTDGTRRTSILLERVCFPHRMFFQCSILSLRQDSLQEEEKARSEDKKSSSHFSTLLVKIEMKKNAVTIYQYHGKCITTSIGSMTKMLCIGWNYDEHNIEAYSFGRRRQMPYSLTILWLHLEGDFNQSGDWMCTKDSTLRLAPSFSLEYIGKRSGNICSSATLWECFIVRLETDAKHLGANMEREITVETTNEQCPIGVWKQMQHTDSSVDEKPKFGIDLRVEGELEDDIFEDEEHMWEINGKLDNLRIGSCTNLFEKNWRERMVIWHSAKNQGVWFFFEMGNMVLFDFWKCSATVQCHSCLKHMSEGIIFWKWGVCLRPDEDIIIKIKARFQVLIAPYYHAQVNRSRGKRHGDQPWQEDHWKAVDATRGARKHNYSSIVSRW